MIIDKWSSEKVDVRYTCQKITFDWEKEPDGRYFMFRSDTVDLLVSLSLSMFTSFCLRLRLDEIMLSDIEQGRPRVILKIVTWDDP